jgi:hypothetical protein
VRLGGLRWVELTDFCEYTFIVKFTGFHECANGSWASYTRNGLQNGFFDIWFKELAAEFEIWIKWIWISNQSFKPPQK